MHAGPIPDLHTDTKPVADSKPHADRYPRAHAIGPTSDALAAQVEAWRDTSGGLPPQLLRGAVRSRGGRRLGDDLDVVARQHHPRVIGLERHATCTARAIDDATGRPQRAAPAEQADPRLSSLLNPGQVRSPRRRR